MNPSSEVEDAEDTRLAHRSVSGERPERAHFAGWVVEAANLTPAFGPTGTVAAEAPVVGIVAKVGDGEEVVVA